MQPYTHLSCIWLIYWLDDATYTYIPGIWLIYWWDDATLHLYTWYLVDIWVGWCNFTSVYLVSG